MAREMKDSGIEWIGTIPNNWEIYRIKNLADPGQENSFIDGDWIESPDISEEGIRYLTTGNVGDGQFKRQGNGYVTEETFTRLNCKYAYPDDLVIARLNAPYGRACILPDDHDKYVLAVDIVILRTKMDRQYLCHQMQCAGYQKSVEDEAKGTTMKRISRTNLGKIPLAIPPLQEQHRIAAFLDRKCAEIDSVIANTQRTIEEYKRLKQSIITEAVTKGVRGKRPMKDSGIKWLCEMPTEWKVVRGKQIFFETNERSIDGHEELLTVSHITGVTPRSMKNVNMFMSESLVDYKICHVGDLASNTMWMWQGAIGVSQYEGVISPSYNTYRQRANTYNPEYLEYLLRIPALVSTYAAYSTGITASRLRLYPDQFFSILFPVPSLDEQEEIVSVLNTKVPEMDRLIERKEALISELESYKKSVIYEYVTGKKEVPACP